MVPRQLKKQRFERLTQSAYPEVAYVGEDADKESTDSDRPEPEPAEKAVIASGKCSAYPEPIYYQKTVKKESTYRTQPVSSHDGEVGSQDAYVLNEPKKSDPKLSFRPRVLAQRSRTWTISAPGSPTASLTISDSTASSSAFTSTVLDGEDEPPQVSKHAWGPLRWVLALWLVWILAVLAALFVAHSPKWSYSGYSNHTVDYNDKLLSALGKAASNLVSRLPIT
ncbi:hypothetical protein MMC27_002347 [Xylographa pallens]|nr:hypothetical protein [Xylographa pallens]